MGNAVGKRVKADQHMRPDAIVEIIQKTGERKKCFIYLTFMFDCELLNYMGA